MAEEDVEEEGEDSEVEGEEEDRIPPPRPGLTGLHFGLTH